MLGGRTELQKKRSETDNFPNRERNRQQAIKNEAYIGLLNWSCQHRGPPPPKPKER